MPSSTRCRRRRTERSVAVVGSHSRFARPAFNLAPRLVIHPDNRAPAALTLPVPALSLLFLLYSLPLHMELDAPVALAASRSPVGVDRIGFSEPLDRRDAAGIDAVRGQVLIDDVGTPLGQPLVVFFGTYRVGVTVDFHLHVGITVQGIDRLLQDRH